MRGAAAHGYCTLELVVEKVARMAEAPRTEVRVCVDDLLPSPAAAVGEDERAANSNARSVHLPLPVGRISTCESDIECA